MSRNFISSIYIHNYLYRINKFPILTKDEEEMYFKQYISSGNINAAHILVTSHLRLVIAVVIRYKDYGIPLIDLISEGNIGLMKAVRKFKPSKRARLSTYAMWWIKSFIQDYIVRSWSILKVNPSIIQKELFTSIKSFKNKINYVHHRLYTNSYLQNIEINSLTTIADTSLNIEEDYYITQEKKINYLILRKALEKLSHRERDIVKMRRLTESIVSLKNLSIKYSISCERVRQIEYSSLKKIKSIFLKNLIKKN